MQNRPVWVAFLLACFLITGMVGLFASYAPAIPLERALYRITTQDEGQPGDARAAARRQAVEEGEAESRAVGNRTRLMLGVVTIVAGGLGAGILLLASRDARG